jgi:hypothetical protein
MRGTKIIVAIGIGFLVTVSCSDSGITYPTGAGGWQVAISLSEIPPWIDDVPVSVAIQGDAINLSNGERPRDGAVLVFSASGGSFNNGLTEIELESFGGRAVAELEIVLPGTYEVEVAYPEQSCSAVAVFSVGLE